MRRHELETDPWDRDPQVQSVRHLFAAIEAGQKDLLEQLGISPYDIRLGLWRQSTLNLFEKIWGLAIRRGVSLNEGETVLIYQHSFLVILCKDGLIIPEGVYAKNESIPQWIREILP